MGGPNDVYVHAEVQGASSVVIKNHQGAGHPIPPKTLHEAGQMALCYSVAWDSQLALGFGFMFKLDEESIPRHANERKVRTQLEEDEIEIKEQASSDKLEECEIKVEDDEPQDEAGEAAADGQGSSQQMGESQLEDQEEKSSPEVELKPDGDNGDESSGKENEECDFPDTELKVVATGQGRIEFVAAEMENGEGETPVQSEPVVFVDSKAGSGVNKTGGEKKEPSKRGQPAWMIEKKSQPTKRGQKGKMKKMKEKYKDQDEEDKELAMQLLQKTSKEDSKKNRKKQEKLEADARKKKNAELNLQRMNRNAAAAKTKQQQHAAAAEGSGDEDEDKTAAQVVNVASEMLDSLTGVPVVGPYSTMVNYRFKVKVTPGSSKRGKAAKKALNVFLSDKAALSRDKDLLKSVKDQDIASNLPGKVKVSTLVKK